MGLTERDLSGELTEILEDLGFKLKVKYNADEIYHYALMDKKIHGNQITMVIPESIGKCRLQKISLHELRDFIAAGLE